MTTSALSADGTARDTAVPKRAPRVLLVGTHLSTSRFNHSVSEDLALRLAGAGWNVTTTSARTTRIGRLADMLQTAWRRRSDYDVAQVDVYSGPAFIWAEAVCLSLRRAGKPYVLTLHGGNLPQFARRWPRRVRRLLATAAAVTAPSTYLYERMRPYRENLMLLPNPLDTDQFRFMERREVRPQLVWVRAFQDIYNPEMAVRAAAHLQPEFPDVQLTMVGPDKGGCLSPVKALAVRLGIGAHVTWPGGVPHDEVPHWLAGGDIFLNTSRVDNTPVSVLEAMAEGLCIVSTNVGGLPYLLDDERDALLVPPDDAEAMAHAVRRLLTNPELAARLSRNGRKKALQCSWAGTLPRWTRLLREAAECSVGR